MPQLSILSFEGLSDVFSLDELSLDRFKTLFKREGPLEQVFSLVLQLLDLKQEIGPLFDVPVRARPSGLQLV